MSEQLLVIILAKVLRFMAGEPARWVQFRRELLKVVRSEDAEQSRQGVLAIAKQLEGCYNDAVLSKMLFGVKVTDEIPANEIVVASGITKEKVGVITNVGR